MTTPLDALVAALGEAAIYNPASEAAPEAVLWCDEKCEFAALLPPLRARLTHLFSFGDIDATTRTGPAIWLRAVVAGGVPAFSAPQGVVPVIWLPGIGRDVLRDAEACPTPLAPLAWLAVSGSFFGHINGKDWTISGFLGADRGPLQLDVPQDGATRQALVLAALTLFERPMETLRGRRIDEAFLHDLIMPDPAADVLRWIEGQLDPKRLSAMAKWAKTNLGFDIAKNDRTDAAAKLARREGGWKNIWARFERNPGFHEPLVQLLYDVPVDLAGDVAGFPRVNDDREAALRAGLLKLPAKGAQDACAALLAMEKENAWRRDTVWAKRGAAPLAEAVRHLAIIAAPPSIPKHNADSFAASYATAAWAVDAAALGALAAAPRLEDRLAVQAALRAVYHPWLDEVARALQALASGINFRKPATTGGVDAVLFVDGLRMDLAHRLRDLLTAGGAAVDLGWRWSGFPTVTATCKPLASPVGAAFSGGTSADGFSPLNADGKPVTQPILRKALLDAGWVVEPDLATRDRIWLEAGTFDADGHSLGPRLVDTLPKALRDVADTVLRLARAGKRVRVITDHGWLLMPGGLEKATLETGLTEPSSKWSRCAVVKPGAKVSVPQFGWTWNPTALVATAPGACAFFNGVEYAHGGISPQECVIPELIVAPLAGKASAQIVDAAWKNMRLNVRVENAAGCRIDLRTGGVTGPSIAPALKDIEADGAASLLIDYDHAGTDALLVVLDGTGAVVARKAMKVAG